MFGEKLVFLCAKIMQQFERTAAISENEGGKFAMYSTAGIDAIATITELRSKTSKLLDHVRRNRSSVLIQKNNEPFAVLMDWETYLSLINEPAEKKEKEVEDRPARRRGRKKASEKEETATTS